jgi:hypothetical protein
MYIEQKGMEMAKYLANERAGKKEDQSEEGHVQFYTKNTQGQYELWKPQDLPLLTRVISFLKALKN